MNKNFHPFQFPYTVNPKYTKRVAYFSMEFAIDQPLKIYSGGLGYLAGSHMRSAYELKQNLIGIGILWKYGYYDQVRKADQGMTISLIEKQYSFLQKIDVKFVIKVNKHPVWVTAYYLAPEVFGTAPMFLLSTDLPENDLLAQNIVHQLYHPNNDARIAAMILLGYGGAKLLDILNYTPDIYHLNESHGLPAAFYLYDKFKSVDKVKEKMVFTTHTPEEAGNPKNSLAQLEKMSFFGESSSETIKTITGVKTDVFDHSLVSLRLSHISNAVSALHGDVSREMWKDHSDICPIIHITNSQNKKYWADEELYFAMGKDDTKHMQFRKKLLKRNLFKVVADQQGKIFDENVFTLVWARRFAGYKRADLFMLHKERFDHLMEHSKYPIQLVWAGKPYPYDQQAIDTFNDIVKLSKNYSQLSILTGYELSLSKLLKGGADAWLNTPRVKHEASGTSGMTAAMNGALNFSTQDGWIPEFMKHMENGFYVPLNDDKYTVAQKDKLDELAFFDMLEKVILPLYYDHPEKWMKMVKQSMKEVLPFFDSDRMADEYYTKLY